MSSTKSKLEDVLLGDRQLWVAGAAARDVRTASGRVPDPLDLADHRVPERGRVLVGDARR